MANIIKEQQAILEKLNIHQLNKMQEEAIPVIEKTKNTILLSPTGTGKTLAFLLPIINSLDINLEEIQALILVPSRELAIQIEQVVREMGSGFKVNAVYGGRPISKDKIELKHKPAILIGTPGRIQDHFRGDRFSKDHIETIVLDEFDKSLETGFEEDMKAIINQLTNIKKRILTSATQGVEIPVFVSMTKPVIINYLEGATSKLAIRRVMSPSKNKLNTLLELLNYLGNQPGIIFCNLRESIQTVSEFLDKHEISHGCFNGGMEQKDRERTLMKFRNGTYQVIVATDLAARGIDIPELKYIVHFELPRTLDEFTHRNGRTARVNAKGTAYVLAWEKEYLPEFIKDAPVEDITKQANRKPQYWQTLFISGGRKDKISKGDIAGLFFKQGNLHKDQLGVIELKQDCAFVAVPASIADQLVEQLNNSKLKKKKVRVTVV
jgi:superfamily II DNA/RNA helicase